MSDINKEFEVIDKEFAEKCNDFEETLTEEQQTKFYELEGLISTISSEQRKTLRELVILLDRMYDSVKDN